MNIDWFTIVAQAINFIVLLWLMKRFLYKPILNAIDKREKRIAERLASAEAKKDAADTKKEEYEHKLEDLNRQRAAFLKEAQDEGHAEKRRILREAQEASDALSKKRKEDLVAEELSLHEEVSQRTQKEVFSLTRKVLADLAGVSLEEQVVGAFIRRLKDLDESKKKGLKTALENGSDTVVVRTALAIPSGQQGDIESSIKKIFDLQPKVTFESSPDLICGIELSVNGQKVAWSVSDYLTSLEGSFEDLLKENVR